MKREAVTNDAVLKTVLLSDLVGSTELVERLGDKRTAWLFARHDRLARDLMVQYGGLEIDKADGFLLLFERPLWAVRYALAYHEAIDELGKDMNVELAARVGIHLGEVILRDNSSDDVSRGAKPIEVEGLAKPIASRLMSLALAHQTLLSRSAFEIAYRAAAEMTEPVKAIRWLSHGAYRIQGVEMPVRIFEVGIEGFAPLAPPASSDKGQRASGEMTLAVPASGVPLIDPRRPAARRDRSEPGWPGDLRRRDEPTRSPEPTAHQPTEIVSQVVAALTAESARKTDLERSRARRQLAVAVAGFLVLLAAVIAYQNRRMTLAVERAAQEAARADETLAEVRQLSRFVNELRDEVTPPAGPPPFVDPAAASPDAEAEPESPQPALLLPALEAETERDVIDLCRRLVARQDAAGSPEIH